VTAVSSRAGDVMAKRVGLLHELLPRAARFGLLVNPNELVFEDNVREVQSAVSAIGRQIEVFTTGTSREITAAFASLAQKRVEALLIGTGGLFTGRRVQVATLATRYVMPTISPRREIVETGGLMSYGPPFPHTHPPPRHHT